MKYAGTTEKLIDGLNKLLESERLYFHGLCFLVYVLTIDGIITEEQQRLLDNFIETDGPESRYCCGLYKWPEGEWEPRKEWLEQQIEKLKLEENDKE